jgi:myosin-crossreactive antigen
MLQGFFLRSVFTVHRWRRLAFGGWRSAFGVRRLAFTVHRLPFAVHRLPAFTALGFLAAAD